MTINENTYNPIQISYNIRRNANGDVIEKSTLVNVRTEGTVEAIKLYNELKSQLNGELSGNSHADSAKSSPTTIASSNSAAIFGSANNCPKCGSQLKERHGKSGSSFLGCSNYPNCRFVRNI